jgi:cytochrome c peroxidase
LLRTPAVQAAASSNTAAAAIGQRLFLETRFAQYFAAHMTGVNNPLPVGDAVVETVQTPAGPQPGPFAGQSMNCESCHFTNEFDTVLGAGSRANADFVPRSPMPRPVNGFVKTPRNATEVGGALQPHQGAYYLHWDGEFISPLDLVAASFTGRNFGWLPTQQAVAMAHIGKVIRQDNGKGTLAIDRTAGLSYATLLAGTSSAIPGNLRLPTSLRLNVATATDAQILHEVSQLVTAYMQTLLYQQSVPGLYDGSPYDAFLKANNLPAMPNPGEDRAAYVSRLTAAVDALTKPIFITPNEGFFHLHNQPWQFGPQELAGLQIFLRTGSGKAGTVEHAGNCASCHRAPEFTDDNFHTTGVTQKEYDGVHGAGSFARLAIPTLAQRNLTFNTYMPASPEHPDAQEPFRRAATPANATYTDLGLWNNYLNPDNPSAQTALAARVCAPGIDCSVDQGLGHTIAAFRTSRLRDLEDSAPYFHNGSAASLEAAVHFYTVESQLESQGKLRNGARELQKISMNAQDEAAVVAFLRSLTEDYNHP